MNFFMVFADSPVAVRADEMVVSSLIA